MAEQNIMTKVMKLLERAEHPSTPPAEAASCRAMAESIMIQNQIDRMDLKPEDKKRVIKSDWEIRVDDNAEFKSHIFTLLIAIIEHCGLRNHPRAPYRTVDGKTDYTHQVVTTVGYPEDIAYAERIWYNTFKTFVENVNPHWDLNKSLGENIFVFIRAGFSWQQVHQFAYDAREDHYGLPVRGQGGGSKLRNAYKEELERRGEEWGVTRRNKAYRTSFARSFTGTIGNRLYQMRMEAKKTVSNSDRYALAIVDTKEQVDREFYLLYPDLHPDAQRKKREEAEYAAAIRFASLPPEEQRRLIAEERRRAAKDEADYQRRLKRARAGYDDRRASDKVDADAWARGAEVARTVNLRNDGEVHKTAKRGELG